MDLSAPFIRNDLPEAVHHACVVILPGHRDSALDLHARLDHVERVHDQDLRHASHSTGGELVDEGEGRLGRHGVELSSV